MTKASFEATQIAERAESQLGVSFRLHGRAPGRSLDCVGLAAYSLFGLSGLGRVAVNYRLRGYYEDWLAAELQNLGLKPQLSNQPWALGDLIVFKPSASQVHLGISTKGGVVHAHAGLRKIVMTPDPQMRVIGHWRLEGI